MALENSPLQGRTSLQAGEENFNSVFHILGHVGVLKPALFHAVHIGGIVAVQGFIGRAGGGDRNAVAGRELR